MLNIYIWSFQMVEEGSVTGLKCVFKIIELKKIILFKK